ncbi:MAG TPA: PIG-L deacetylase family protein [Solirubrobacteraceae bacterium]|nr:PIG-L deacetylase family protein [Solirubrobacteraceae bacterium]
MTRVLVVCAHPDDEAVGCGGTLRLHALDGDRIITVFLTSGERGGHGEEDHARTREREARRAAAILGIEALQFWHEADGRLRAGGRLVRRLTKLIDSLRPARVYVPHARDDHPDHRAAARLVRLAVVAAATPPLVRGFEIWSPLSAIEEVVDISSVLPDKRRAIRAYRSQCAVMDLDHASVGLARYRGEMHSWPGGPYAEVFSRG